MAAVSVRGLDDAVRDRLRRRAARNGRSMEAEMRAILEAAAADEPDQKPDLISTLVDRFHRIGGIELDLPERDFQLRPPPDFDR